MSEIMSNAYQSLKGAIVRQRRLFVTLTHLVQAALANYFAFILRFESVINPKYLSQLFSHLYILLLIRLVFYLAEGLHKDLWRYSSVRDLSKLFRSITLGSIVFMIVIRYVLGDYEYPRSIYILDWLLLIFMAGGSRLFIRVFREYVQSEAAGKKVLIIGAGDAGEMIVRDMRNNPKYAYTPIGFIDDDPYKKGLTIHGIPILGTREAIGEVYETHQPDEILIAIPSESPATIRELYERFKSINLPIKTLPSMHDIISGKVSVSQIRPLHLEDLLMREPVRTDIESVKLHIEGKRVLVTGAGGSIGSELARQIAAYGPSNLILLDRYENGLFEVDFELHWEKGFHNISTVVCDVLDGPMMQNIFSRHSPQIVFHAAAHKHVPLMEQNPLEAVKNNVFGTVQVIEASLSHSVESFIMVSTDKAVNPANIMGATKRIAELLTIASNRAARAGGGKFSAVRFGNVLGSNASVVHTFKEQVKRGGPITVTHPDMERFFMLIDEAVQLVLIAAASGSGGDIFVLDMGEPIKILDMAENIIRLSGLVPHEDIKVEFTGLRPGEKLFEELFDKSEKIVDAPHARLKKAVPTAPPSDEELKARVEALRAVVRDNRPEDLHAEIKKIIPGFKSQGLV